MVGMVIVSHNELVAQGVKEMAQQMVGDIKLEIAAGTNDHRMGTDINKILEAINNVYSDEGVLILFDLGSSLMNTEMAIEFLPENMKSKVKILDTPLVEGAIITAIECSLGKSIDEIKAKVESENKNKL